ncbi:hypothetical protein B0H15DRAFT_948189 [Mycena belliarum]|uniref:Uncharacterized protein n=1 Tax=Mycena belliarum TaxID=1033014 RepID=A0AAD6XSE2_9AGAR|nr:hypothetical protein B0H15DRAFT_948189 [Mycena belliae]
MSHLRPQLAAGAQRLFRIFKDAGVEALLVGGAAAAAGGNERDTKDLDVNLFSTPKQTVSVLKALRQHGITVTPLEWAGRYSANIPASAPGKKDAVKVDLAVKGNSSILAYTQTTVSLPGVVFANTQWLLVDKIRTMAERVKKDTAKQSSDLLDIQYCLNSVTDPLPQDLLDHIPETVWAEFWERAQVLEPDFIGLARVLFPPIGLPKPPSASGS